MSSYAVGIDLGTTHSCVAVYKHGKVEIIANDHGYRTTPSCVSFTKNERLVGEPAVIQSTVFPKYTIYDAKRLIGRRYYEETVQVDLCNWPFTVIDSDGFPKIQVCYDGENILYTPEEISSMVLLKMKKTAEDYLEKNISKVVITVPAYFNYYQKQATMNAGKLAGLDVMYILSEPVAAAVTYAAEKENVSGTVMVFDLGGGTLDVTIVSIHHGINVKSISGNTHLGGQDFTNNLVNHFVELFKRKHNRDLRSNERSLSRLKRECEITKKNLSHQLEVSFIVDSIMDGIDINEKITRAKFNEINSDDFASTLIPVQKALDSANITSDDVEKIIMSGGSCRIPKIESLLSEFFGGKEILKSINPDEAIAYGAGIYAAVLNGINIGDHSHFIIKDVTPQSLRLGVNFDATPVDADAIVIIPKNSVVPISNTTRTETRKDMQTSVSFPIYEGESENASENTFLGEFTLRGIPPGPKGKEKFDVTFSVDVNRILKVTAVHVGTGRSADTIIDRRLK